MIYIFRIPSLLIGISLFIFKLIIFIKLCNIRIYFKLAIEQQVIKLQREVDS